MEIENFTKLNLSNLDVTAFTTKLNILKNSEIIFPHEETMNDNRITDSIINNSVIVLGVIFESFDNNLVIKDQIFILDGHHRYQFIKDNFIDDLFEVVLVSMSDIKIESYNSELLIVDDIFVNKIKSEKGFSEKNNSKYFISLNNKKYFSAEVSDINELYYYKKQLLKESIILPIKNNEKTNKSLVKFTPITQKNFCKNHIFPYKSTWIMPRFDV